MGRFSLSPRNIKRTKVIVAPYPSHDSLLDKPTTTRVTKEELMYRALLKMSARRKFRAAIRAVIFTNLLKERAEQKRLSVRKLRASVRCINFAKLLEERVAVRRKFRASVYAIGLVDSLATGIIARRKFRAAVNIIMIADRLVNRPLHESFNLQAFQDTVNLEIAVTHLETPFTTKSLQPVSEDMVVQDENVEQINHLDEAAIDDIHVRERNAKRMENWSSPTIARGSLTLSSEALSELQNNIGSVKIQPHTE